jgi:5-methylcytosine-specific restriction endonuclease McrA
MTYKLYAPLCVLPDCSNKVAYHKRYIKKDGTPGWRWKTFCEKHRTTVLGKAQVEEFKRRRGGCENRDGHLGWTCLDPDTPSLTIDHIDGDKYNNQEDNYKVLCANCHNRKTPLFGDNKKRYRNVSKVFDELFIEVSDEPKEVEKI